jgi:hypothetical protein
VISKICENFQKVRKKFKFTIENKVFPNIFVEKIGTKALFTMCV